MCSTGLRCGGGCWWRWRRGCRGARRRLGLPWGERRGPPALTAAPVRLALLVYELAERNFPREELLALLTSPLVRLGQPGDSVPPHRLARWLREARVRDDAADDP